MAQISVKLEIDLPNWAWRYVESLKRRRMAGEQVDTDGAALLISKFANYRIIRSG